VEGFLPDADDLGPFACGMDPEAEIMPRIRRRLFGRRSADGFRQQGGVMAAYVIADVDVRDPEGFERYRKLAIPTLAKWGARVLAGGGDVEVLEGSWDPKRLAIVEFASTARAQQWYASPGYSKAKPILRGTATANLVIVEGV
jgi:uncharacterized protein (DUF1330 family)